MKRRSSKLPNEKQQALIAHFVNGTPARIVAAELGIQANTANLYYKKIRNIITASLDYDMYSKSVSGEKIPNIEIDRRYLHKDMDGYVPFIAIWKDFRGHIRTQLFQKKKNITRKPSGLNHRIIRPHAIVYVDRNSLTSAFSPQTTRLRKVDVIIGVQNVKFEKDEGVFGYKTKPVLMKAEEDTEKPFVEDFWVHSKAQMRKYRGIKYTNFYGYLKECEFRFKYGSPAEQIQQLEEWLF